MTRAPDEATVQAALAAAFRGPVKVAEVSPLAGDASTRRYFRVRLAPGFIAPTFILMHYPDEVPPGAELPFVNVHRYLEKAGVPVPRIHLWVPESHLLFLEDAGDTLLENAVAGAASVPDAVPLYEACMEILVRIQWDGTRSLDAGAVPARLAFDVRKFAEEIDFFFEHAVRGYGGIPLRPAEERTIENRFLPFLERLSSLPRVLAHRDYHSRNIMVLPRPGVPAGRPDLRVLDFQDARMGNVFYDLCSLLRDSYVTLPESMVDHLCYAYRHAAPASLRRKGGDAAAFAYHLDVASLQRNVKAIGTFGNQAHSRGKRFYLRFLPPTVAHVAANIERNPSMRPLGENLLPILRDLAAKAQAEPLA